MRLYQAINEKIHMCDRIILALTSPPATDYNVAGDELDDMVDFLEAYRQRLRSEAKELDVFGEIGGYHRGQRVTDHGSG